jgi:penicillin amidase
MNWLPKLLKYLRWILGGLFVIALAAAGYGWWQIRGSLAQLDGARPLAGLGAAVKVERDALGVPVITGATRADVARATGFVHAQDRFFQMDLLRRSGAGELAEIFGAAALPLDRAHRLHQFRSTAEKVVAALTPERRALLDAYTAGVNAGLAALPKIPWEYLVLRTPPQPWRNEDTFLCVYAMWFDLQDWQGSFELNNAAVREAFNQTTLNFLNPPGNSWDAALDGSTIAPAPLPPMRFKPAAAADQTVGALAPCRTEGLAKADQRPGTESPSKTVTGSNSFAVGGQHTATGAAMLANDMHLGFSVPHIWYRASLVWGDGADRHRVDGVTLPGSPFLVVGSNGRVAWGFTDAYVDTTDVIMAETDTIAQIRYRTAQGWVDIEDRSDPIKVKGRASEPFTARWTGWGPIISGPTDGHYLVLRWVAHDPEATNINLMELETARTTAEAVDIMHRAGIPHENALIADADGAVAWTIVNRLPRRVGYDGRLPVSWSYGDRKWDGWLRPDEIPVVHPADGLLWSGNNRAVGGDALAKIGDSGYDEGTRAGQIRDDLRALAASGKKVVPADLLAVQLDDRAKFLERWKDFLLAILTDGAVAAKKSRGELRDAVKQWNGHASVDSVAYRVVRDFRAHVADRVFAPFTERAEARYDRFRLSRLHYEDALWQLVHDQPAGLLNPANKSWESLLLAAVDDVSDDADKAGLLLSKFTWGQRNVLAMQHPFSMFLPAPLARCLNMPAVPLAGDSDMPRVNNPKHGQSERMVVSPGHEAEGLFNMPGGQSGHPMSPYYRAGHEAWVKGEPTPLLPGPAQHTLVLQP